MDYDLFQSDDDDEIFTAACIEATQEIPTQNIVTECVPAKITDSIPEFQCAGEDSLNSVFSEDGFIRNNFTGHIRQRNALIEQISVSIYDFHAINLCSTSVAQYVFGEACKNIQFMLASVRGNSDSIAGYGSDYHRHSGTHYQRRHQVTILYHMLLETTDATQWPILALHIERLRRLLNASLDEDLWRLIYAAHSNKGNDSNLPAYHLLHGVLEWRLLDLCLLHKYEICNENNSNSPESLRSFNAQLERTLDDLLLGAAFHYTKKRTTDLLNSSPFPCTCYKEMWLLLQQLIQKWSETTATAATTPVTFWTHFNAAMARLKANLTRYDLQPQCFCLFAVWQIQMLTRLHGYDKSGHFQGNPTERRRSTPLAECNENYEFCETCTQQLLNTQPSEEQLRVYICMLMPLLLHWWRPRVGIVIALWEHFHKRLNSNCYLASGAPSQLAVACGSGRAYLEHYRGLLAKEQSIDMQLSSYTLHTLLLGKTIQQLQSSVNGANHIKKLLGRIYSKFSLQKFLTLNETGIHHLIELFLVLCLCGDINELMPNLREKLLMLEYEKLTLNKQIAVAKGHMALLILHAEHHWDMRDYIGKLLQQLNGVRNEIAVAKLYADSLLDVLREANDCGEHLLIDAWLPHLLSNCTPVEQERTLEALHILFEKIQLREGSISGNGSTPTLLQALHEHILPWLRLQFVNGYSTWLPELAADFCIQAADAQAFQKLFTYFCAAQPLNREAQPHLLLRLLESKRSIVVPPTSVLQIWLKSLVLLTAQHKAVSALTNYIVQLPEYQFMCALPAQELLTAKEPLCSFIAAIGKRYDSCSDYSERLRLTDKLNAYLQNFDQWLQIDAKIEKPELTLRFYSFIAIVIYNCAPLVYIKSKLNCFFHVAITRFVLPTSVQMGKLPEGKLPQLVHKIWPVLLQGIGRLHYKTDAYINKTLNDLIQKWTPNFKISNNTKLVARPYIACLQSDNQALALYVFERLTSMFLAIQRRQSDPNACLVVAIFQEVIAAVTTQSANDETTSHNSEAQLLTFMKACSLLILEHIMMVDDIVPSRGMLLTLFKTILQSGTFKRSLELQAIFAEHLRLLTKKHLSYYTFFYFELLMKFVTISPQIIAAHMEFLRKEIEIVETKRGAGTDQRIRSCFQKLQTALDAQTIQNTSFS